MRTRQLEWMEPIEATRRLGGLPRLAVLDSAMSHPTLGRWSYVAADPLGVFTLENGTARWNGEREAGTPIAALRARLAADRADRVAGLPPFQGGAIGTFAYELGWTLEGREPPSGSRASAIDLAFYDVVLAFDHAERTCRLMASGRSADPSETCDDRAEARLALFAARLARAAPISYRPEAPLVWRQTITRDAFCRNVERVKDYIRDGDVYQTNISQRLVADLPPGSDPLALYERLRAGNPAPFAAFLAQGDRTVLSTSPELFLRTDGSVVETRPIKGTARRKDDVAADRAAACALLASRKDRAENVMIVDLLRNDLSRVCRPESVAVSAMCALESYAGLHHLVSTVTGRLAPDRDALDLLAASFPGGSITGAPKIRAMEIIDAIEREPRGIYCGALGYLGFDGSMELAIAIRTLVVEGATAELRVGGGITILSDPDAEYEETLTKARRLCAAFAAASEPESVCA